MAKCKPKIQGAASLYARLTHRSQTKIKVADLFICLFVVANPRAKATGFSSSTLISLK